MVTFYKRARPTDGGVHIDNLFHSYPAIFLQQPYKDYAKLARELHAFHVRQDAGIN